MALQTAANILANAADGKSPPETLPLSTEAQALLGTLLTVGTIVLLIWLARRIRHPRKLSLREAPGRPNTLNPLHILAVFALWQIVPGLLMVKLKLDAIQLLLVGSAAQTLGIVASIWVAKRTFRLGLLRGLGLSMRHWTFDSIRGTVAFLAVLPVCVGLVELASWLLRMWNPDLVQPHSFLVQLREMGIAGRVMIVLSATVLAPLVEELFFRGLIQSMLRNVLPAWPAVLVTSLLFMIVHAEAQNLPALFVLSTVMGYNYERCGRLWPAILTHALFNATTLGLHLMSI